MLTAHTYIEGAESSGFVKASVLLDRTRGLDGSSRDIVVMEMPLGNWSEWWRF